MNTEVPLFFSRRILRFKDQRGSVYNFNKEQKSDIFFVA